MPAVPSDRLEGRLDHTVSSLGAPKNREPHSTGGSRHKDDDERRIDIMLDIVATQAHNLKDFMDGWKWGH